MNFPAVQGSNLEGRKYRLPGDFEGDLNLVIVAFQQWHQGLVDTWIPTAKALAAATPGLRYYELPTINTMNPISRTFINWGMHAGIPDKSAREATITLYIDKQPFREALQIPNEETIHLFLVRRDGTVLWHGEGQWSEAGEESLRAAVETTA
jgi:hypothetical protein